MECVVCKVRSALGYCSVCQTLLCEECGEQCDECQKRVCPEHVHESRSGRILCISCYAEYAARRHHHHHAAETDAAPAVEGQRGRLSRSREPLRPWLASLYMAVLGVVAVAVLLFFPDLRRINFGSGRGFPTVYVVMVIPLLAVAWAFLGLFTRWTRDAKSLNFIGLALAVVTIGLSFLAVRPAALSELPSLDASKAPEEEVDPRSTLAPGQLGEWRQGVLKQFSEENRPPERREKPIDLRDVKPAAPRGN